MPTLTEVAEALKAHFQNAENDVRVFLEQHLPVIADYAQKEATNPAIAALAQAVHLGEAPEVLQTIADLVTRADAAMGASKAAGVAEATAAAAPVDPAQPA